MALSRYRMALKILEKWPKDPTKGETRDLAVLLRKKIGENFKQGEQTTISDPVKCDKMLASLENICDDKYKMKYILTKPITVGALGQDYNHIHEAASDEAYEYLNQERELLDKPTYFGIFKRWKKRRRG